MKVFITGISRGIGKGLCEKYLSLGYEVYAIGSSNPFREVKFQKVDVSAFELLPKAIENLQMQNIDIAILNAGILGEIKDMKEWSIKELQNIMDINVWANKVIIDNIHTFTKKIVAISSGAAVNGNKGWGGYSISKAALNMLISLYAKEIDSKIDDVSNIEQDVMDNEYFESYEEEVSDNDFEGGFDDFEGLDDFDI